MARYSGKQFKGAATVKAAQRRADAEARQRDEQARDAERSRLTDTAVADQPLTTDQLAELVLAVGHARARGWV